MITSQMLLPGRAIGNIYVKATGKLYRDKGGDAAWNGTNIDLKTGATNENKLVTVLYSDEGTYLLPRYESIAVGIQGFLGYKSL